VGFKLILLRWSSNSKMDSKDAKMDTSEDNLEVVQELESKEFNRAEEIESTQPNEAVALYKQVVAQDDPTGGLVKTKEKAIYRITSIYCKQSRTAELKALVSECRPFFETIAKAKTAKIVRNVIEQIGQELADSVELQTEMCEDAIVWCKQEKRTFLKQRMQSRIASLYLQQNRYKAALNLIKRLLKDVKKFDDKLLLVEIEIIESKVHHALENFPKAKGALTAARSAANSVYCPPLLQAQIDLQSGTLCAEEKDHKTAFSYFYEAFEGFNTQNRPVDAVKCLKYMLLTKIMGDQAEDVYGIVNGKAGIKYAGREVSAMKEIADAYKQRSIQKFEDVYETYKQELANDVGVTTHIDDLKAKLLEQNLIRIIEPFERVQIDHVAKLIKLPRSYIETKLSEMILDKKFAGILDQGAGDLIIFDDLSSDKTYAAGLETVKELGDVVDRLWNKANTLNAGPQAALKNEKAAEEKKKESEAKK